MRMVPPPPKDAPAADQELVLSIIQDNSPPINQGYPLWDATAAGRSPGSVTSNTLHHFYHRIVPPPPKDAPAADQELVLSIIQDNSPRLIKDILFGDATAAGRSPGSVCVNNCIITWTHPLRIVPPPGRASCRRFRNFPFNSPGKPCAQRSGRYRK